MTTKEMIEVMQAYERGEQIEMQAHGAFNDNVWDDVDTPLWNWGEIDYRVKPQSTYRSYKNAEEFLKAQKEHGMMIKLFARDRYFMPISIIDNFVIINNEHNVQAIDFNSLKESYIWQDGEPCKIKA